MRFWRSAIFALATSASSFGFCFDFASSGYTMEDECLAHAYIGDGRTDLLFERLSLAEEAGLVDVDNYSYVYFYNLTSNFGNNAYGSCGYVAAGMLLSFYDAYWDDSVIETKYEIKTTFDGGLQDGADFHLVPMDADSPGISFEPSSLVSNLTIDKYMEVARNNEDKYFQFSLFEIYDYSFELGLSGKGISDLLNKYLYESRGFSTNNVAIEHWASPKTEDMIDVLDDGTPMVLTLSNENGDSHAVVAYDCDRAKGDIYVHPGWWRDGMHTPTHVSLKELGYTQITSAVSLDFKSQKRLGAKYYSKSGDGYAASNFMLPRQIRISSGDYVDVAPTFEWESLYEERWEDFERYFNISLLDSNKHEISKTDGIKEKRYTPSDDDWQSIQLDSPDGIYYVYLTLSSEEHPYWDDLWCIKTFEKPKAYDNVPIVQPHEYGYADSYPTDDETKEEYISHNVRGFKFETRRYRTGYIHNEDIVMSPIRKGINEAFIEYRFETAVERIDVELSHWRELKSELLNSVNGQAVIQQYIDNDWVDVADMLSAEMSLSRSRSSKKIYKIDFTQPTYRIRFYSKYNLTATNDNNKGRICIGQIAFYQSEFALPVSGSEIPYEPNLWETSSVNCYNYALNNQSKPTMQPGWSAHHDSSNTENYFKKETFLSMIKIDAVNYGFEFKEILKQSKCDAGYYKIAIAIAPEYDFHFYRQNPDGSWSHKPGMKPFITKYDYSGKLIMDPSTCWRQWENTNYRLFLGFYQVKVGVDIW